MSEALTETESWVEKNNRRFDERIIRCSYEDLCEVGEQFGRDSREYRDKLKDTACTLGVRLEKMLEEAYRKLP